ncbi:MAG: SDR family NAD(P)-dependent oxidoreductase, partial [Chloroflexi bacterium]
MVVEQFSLAGKAALVIGASNPVAANSCANEIWALDRKGSAQAIDAADEKDVDSLVARANSEFGRLDILVNAQDLHFAKPALEISLAEWRRVVDANLTGVFLACRAAGREMFRRESGRIINISSVLAERGMANGSAYCAAQAGVLNLTRALALEWARSDVTVNAVGAGWI